jgi:hypothetical protein
MFHVIIKWGATNIFPVCSFVFSRHVYTTGIIDDDDDSETELEIERAGVASRAASASPGRPRPGSSSLATFVQPPMVYRKRIPRTGSPTAHTALWTPDGTLLFGMGWCEFLASSAHSHHTCGFVVGNLCIRRRWRCYFGHFSPHFSLPSPTFIITPHQLIDCHEPFSNLRRWFRQNAPVSAHIGCRPASSRLSQWPRHPGHDDVSCQSRVSGLDCVHWQIKLRY